MGVAKRLLKGRPPSGFFGLVTAVRTHGYRLSFNLIGFDSEVFAWGHPPRLGAHPCRTERLVEDRRLVLGRAAIALLRDGGHPVHDLLPVDVRDDRSRLGLLLEALIATVLVVPSLELFEGAEEPSAGLCLSERGPVGVLLRVHLTLTLRGEELVEGGAELFRGHLLVDLGVDVELLGLLLDVLHQPTAAPEDLLAEFPGLELGRGLALASALPSRVESLDLLQEDDLLDAVRRPGHLGERRALAPDEDRHRGQGVLAEVRLGPGPLDDLLEGEVDGLEEVLGCETLASLATVHLGLGAEVSNPLELVENVHADLTFLSVLCRRMK